VQVQRHHNVTHNNVYCSDLDRKETRWWWSCTNDACLFVIALISDRTVLLRHCKALSQIPPPPPDRQQKYDRRLWKCIDRRAHLSAHSRHEGNPMSNDTSFVIQSVYTTTITRRYTPCHVMSCHVTYSNFRNHEGRNTVTLLIWRFFVRAYIVFLYDRIAVTWYGCARKQSPLILRTIMARALRKLGEKNYENIGSWYPFFRPSFTLGRQIEDLELYVRSW
jgi:hypothetical protein